MGKRGDDLDGLADLHRLLGLLLRRIGRALGLGRHRGRHELADEIGTEYAYPAALQAMSVNVSALAPVPEPGIALMLVAGMLLVGTMARRRTRAGV